MTELTKAEQAAVAYAARAAFQLPPGRGKPMSIKRRQQIMDALEKAFEEGVAFARREADR